MIKAAQAQGTIKVAIAHPCDDVSLQGAVEAARLRLIEPVLVGPPDRIRGVADAPVWISARMELVASEHSHDSAAKAVELVTAGRVEALMKGSLHTDELMGAVVSRQAGIRTARRISHCFIMDVPNHPDALIITDAAVNIAPTLDDKVDIVQNAIDLAHAMGVAEVRVAILSAHGDGDREGALDHRGRRAVQDGGAGSDHRRAAGRAARTRQRDQPHGRGNQADRITGCGTCECAGRA